MELQKKFESILKKFIPDDSTYDKAFYHYTSLDAFESMLRTGEIWLSDVAFQSDMSEFKHGLDLSLSIFKEMVSTKKLPGITGKILEMYEKHVENMTSTTRVFIFCLTENRDTLVHWSRFARPPQGVCLQIDIRALARCQVKPQLNFAPYQVAYDDNSKEAAFRELFKAFFEYAELQTSIKLETTGRALSQIFAMIIQLCSFFKSSDFRDENEIRLVATVPETNLENSNFLKFSFKGSNIVPHATAKMTENHVAFSEVFKGILLPMNPGLNLQGVSMLCAKYGISREIVKESKLSYRG